MAGEDSRSCHLLNTFSLDPRTQSESTIRANKINPSSWWARIISLGRTAYLMASGKSFVEDMSV